MTPNMCFSSSSRSLRRVEATSEKKLKCKGFTRFVQTPIFFWQSYIKGNGVGKFMIFFFFKVNSLDPGLYKRCTQANAAHKRYRKSIACWQSEIIYIQDGLGRRDFFGPLLLQCWKVFSLMFPCQHVHTRVSSNFLLQKNLLYFASTLPVGSFQTWKDKLWNVNL